jgi:hypothetical protein
MRQRLLGVGFLVMLASLAVGAAQESGSPLDTPTTLRLPETLPPCGITTALQRLARTSRVAIGFEEGSDCRGNFPRLNVTYDDSGLHSITVRDVLDRLVALSPDYRWSEMNSVAVVRPVTSWNDPTDALNLHVGAFHIDNATVSRTLAVILKLPGPDRDDSVANNGTFSIAFNGGTMVEALNTLVRAREGVGWNARLFVHPGEGQSPTLHLSIRTFRVGDRAAGEGAVLMGTPLARLLTSR